MYKSFILKKDFFLNKQLNINKHLYFDMYLFIYSRNIGAYIYICFYL